MRTPSRSTLPLHGGIACLLGFTLCVAGPGTASAQPAQARAPVQAKQTAAAAAPSASASILIPYPPEAVWPVVSNPETLSSREPKVRSVRVLRRHGQGAVVAYDVSMSPMLPNFKYTLFFRPVAPYRRIEFHRLSGSFEHFDGSWTLHPEAQGQATRLTYALRVDPGFWAPAFLIQNAIQRDLPRMLTRVGQVVAEKAQAH